MKRNMDELIAESNKAVDFHRVLEQIAQYASFSCSKQTILQARPDLTLFEIRPLLEGTKEAMAFFHSGYDLNMGGCSDISENSLKAQKQMTLLPVELVEIARFLMACKNVINDLKEKQVPSLWEVAVQIDDLSRVRTTIENQIDDQGHIRDHATERLASLIRQESEARFSLQDKCRQFIRSHADSLMETVATSMNGRVCVLVKAQDKNRFGSMIHGQSSSGMAFYVEPNVLIPYNNRLQSIQVEIEEEKHKICRKLSLMVGKHTDILLSNLENITWIDVAFTKARWAIAHDGCIPVFHQIDHSFRFEHAVHPLLDPETAVANSYSCRSDQYCLMISGPNMGGKTVTLKTIGLFMLLAHCGFPVAAHEAFVPYYDSLWFNIGDNQSIENNLSTFSGHISVISEICQKADEHSFILLDELGNGTDPLEGCSLAIAILEYLIEKKCTVITTTHYNQVKTFGKTHPHVLVSSVEFDSETLQPTYRYIPGISGASYALSIAAQYHLDASILKRAEALKEANTSETERKIKELETMQEQVRRKQERFEQLIQDAHRVQKEAYEQKQQIEEKKKQIDQEYEEELQEMLEQKRAQAQQIIVQLKQQKSGKMHEHIEKLHEINNLGSYREVETESADETINIGDYVQIKDLNTHGEVLEIRRKEATVLVNEMKMKIKMNRLRKINRPKPVKQVHSTKIERSFTRFPLELNLIGMRVSEALETLDHYLDSAIVNHANQVRIIHGMGTGALRAAIWKELDKHPNVKAKTSAGPSDGGLGATIVILK